MSDDGKNDPEADGHVQQDLSIPVWVWTLLGFALVTAVVIIVIIWGGAAKPADEPGDTPGVDETPVTQPATNQSALTRPA